jgi:16S rRNA (guanine966-N2)-methyltransferase
VIAGEVGGLRLVAPKGLDTRPTTDRVKESLFAALGPDRIDDVSVLDLYAGSGALGIEALSRGARQALLVDRDPEARKAIHENLEHTRLADRARVQRAEVVSTLKSPRPPEAPFDLVFLDPPYDFTDDELSPVLELLVTEGWLSAGATVVLERPARSSPRWPEKLVLVWERSYGDTVVLIASTDRPIVDPSMRP